MAKRQRKHYIFRKGSRVSVFTGRTPRQAALKAAAAGITDIRLRERGRRNSDGTYSIHVFKGSVRSVKLGDDRPSWLPATVKKGFVKKVGVERIDRI